MAHLSACLATLWEWGVILDTKYITHGIIAVGIVHDGACLGIHHEVLQTSACRVVAVEGLCSITILQVGALLDEVCSSTHINYLTLFVLYIAYGF